MKKLNRSLLISKAYSYLIYLFKENISQIKSVYLFGSVARGDFDTKSDIDLFIDLIEKSDFQKILDRSIKKFNTNENKKWMYKGVNNEINIKFGRLNEWKLKSSINKDSILLYGFSNKSFKKHFVVNIKPIKKTRITVIRKLFGRNENEFKSIGLVQNLNGKILNPRTFIVPSENIIEISKVFSKYKVDYELIEVWI